MSQIKTVKCYCKSGKSYQTCCAIYHQSLKKPETCEQLMRSRFSAFILQLGEYLFNTYHPDFRADLTIEQLSEKSLDWRNLQIIDSKDEATTGVVEFKAWYLSNGHLECHHERSNFMKIHDQWLYCDGTFYPAQKSGKIARNMPCPCGSGKKYKKCCAIN